MTDTDKAVIAAFRAASDGLQDAISGGQNADGQEVDARIAAAYVIFPGNVGGEDALYEAVMKLNGKEETLS